MTSKLTREQATDTEIQMLIDSHENGTAMFMRTDAYYFMAKELQERRKAERDSQPVAYTDERNLGYIDRGRETAYLWGKQNSEAGDIPLYRHAQPTPERDQVRREHAEWSQATFGDVGPVGPLKHLSKEALEAAAEPDDLSEWADMQFLLWDAQRRAGITGEQITQAMTEKLAVNKQREWPEPKDGEPRLHIKEQPAPVVPPEQHWEELCRQHPDMSIGDAIIRAAWWNHCRTAMLQAAPVCTCPSGDGSLRWPCPVHTGNSPVIGIDPVSGPDRTVEVRYVAPPGYVMVPKEMTDEIGEAIAMQANCCGGIALDIYDAMLAAAPQEVPDGEN